MDTQMHVFVNEQFAGCDFSVSNAWLPLLGPTASAIVRVLVEHWPDRDEWTVDELAARSGVAPLRFWSATSRLERFGVAAWASTDVLVVRRYLDPPPERAIERVLTRHREMA